MPKSLRGVDNRSGELATRVKHFRWDREWNQYEMAEYVRVSLRTIKRIEAGEEIGEEMLYRLEKMLKEADKKGRVA